MAVLTIAALLLTVCVLDHMGMFRRGFLKGIHAGLRIAYDLLVLYEHSI